jgi:hypothetical protein
MKRIPTEAVEQTWQMVALIHGEHRFIFVYDAASWEMMIDEIRTQAANPQSLFSWPEAFQLIERIRQSAQRGMSVAQPEGPAQSETPEASDPN